MPHDAMSEDVAGAVSPEAALARVASENALLRSRLDLAETSAAVQAMRAGALVFEVGLLRRQARIMRASLFWRITLPLRLAVDLARGAPETGSPGAVLLRRFITTLRGKGWRAARSQARLYLRQRRRATAAEPADDAPALAPAAVSAAAPVPAGEILAPMVLIVAELSVPQCAKYRVWQKQQMLQSLGVRCVVLDWHDTFACRSAAALATQAILYRLPATPEILSLIELLESLGVPAAWEVDDLIFDEPLYRQNSNLAALDAATQENLLQGVRLYRAALLRTGRAIASTPGLAAAMRQAGIAEVAVVENALDAETLWLATEIRATRAARPASDNVLIVYGSGTRTHDADFRQAAPAICQLMHARPEVRLRIVGDLTLPPELLAFGARVEAIGLLPYPAFLRLLGEADISIAPLEATEFNDAKSSIKFLEAAILGVPCVCSPRAAFTAALTDGEHALLAEGDAPWLAALSRLATDPALRARIGAAGQRLALDRFDPASIAARQLAPLVLPDRRRQPKFRVLFANVFFAPRSYGGATLVVEEMVKRFAAEPGTDVHVVTTTDGTWRSYAQTRGTALGVPVYSLPSLEGDHVGEFDNPQAAERFDNILAAVQPQVVHLHSVQRISASVAEACLRRDIPYVITLHDAWWICARQFMVRADGQYCFQTNIDLHVCEACVPTAKHLRLRQRLLRGVLDNAALLLCPSEAHRQVYLAQGIAPHRIVVTPNGVRLPASSPPRPAAGVLRFAYVGGFEPVKGYNVLRQAAEALPRGDWELVLVDNTLKLGFASIDVADWRVRGTLTVRPPYDQDGLDEFFAGIDVLLFPSQWKESFGLTVREALARDVWVIATQGGGAAEAIEDGVNGTLIPLDGRAAPLQAAIEALLDNPAQVRGFSNPMKATIIDYDHQAADLRMLLEHVAGIAP